MKAIEGPKGPAIGSEGNRAANPSRNTEMERLRKQRLCFHCREKWQYGHKCKPRGNVAMVEECEEEKENSVVIEEEASPDEKGEGAEVSLNAVVGGEQLNTIKLPGLIKNREIMVLIDSGSTHSLLTLCWFNN